MARLKRGHTLSDKHADGHRDGQIKGGERETDTQKKLTWGQPTLRGVRPEPRPKIRHHLAIDTHVVCDRVYSEFSSDQIAMWSTAHY